MAWNTLPEEAGLDKEVGKEGSGAKCGRAFWGVWASEQADLDLLVYIFLPVFA